MLQETGCHGYGYEHGERVGLRLNTGAVWRCGGVAGRACCHGNVCGSVLIPRHCGVIWGDGVLTQNLSDEAESAENGCELSVGDLSHDPDETIGDEELR